MDKQLVHYSKRISKALRHKPDSLGLELDEHGWADVNRLIKGLSRDGSFTFEMLETIVRENNKQRYSFNEDRTKIRANQGHSIPVDVELEQKAPPEILYHGTGAQFGDSILAEGLKPMERLYVHLSADTDTAVNVGRRHGKPIVFRVLAGKMYQDGYLFFLSVNGVWLTDKVPPEYLESENT